MPVIFSEKFFQSYFGVSSEPRLSIQRIYSFIVRKESRPMTSIRKSKRLYTQSSIASKGQEGEKKSRLKSQPNSSLTFTPHLAASFMGFRSEAKQKMMFSSAFQEPHLIKIALSSHLKQASVREDKSVKQDTAKYEIEKVIAQGSSGCVYLAHSKDNKKLAIKQVVAYGTKQNRELSLLKSMKHLNILALEDYYFKTDKDRSLLHLVTSYYPATISTLIHQRAIRKQFVPLYAFQILNGLSYLRDNHIMHRDLTPPNILVDTETNRVVIGDFGSAKYAKSYEHSLSYVCARSYRAPQLFFGATNYSTQIDIWSFGCILVEIVTGTPFCRGKTSIEQILEVIKRLGTPTQSQMAAMNPHYSMQEYQILPKIKPKVLRDIVNIRDPLLLDLISKVLIFDPSKRLTPDSAMEHPFFNCIKDEQYLKEIGVYSDFFAASDESTETKSINLSPESPESPLKQRSLRLRTEQPRTAKLKGQNLKSLGVSSIRLKRRLF